MDLRSAGTAHLCSFDGGLMATALSPYVGHQMTARRQVLVAVVERV